MTWFARALLITTLCAAPLFGCGDDDKKDSDTGDCAEASKILADCGSEDEIGECNAEGQALARCVVMHPEGACTDELNDESDAFLSCLIGP